MPDAPSKRWRKFPVGRNPHTFQGGGGVFKISDAGDGRIGGDFLGERGGLRGIRFEGGDDVDPIQCMQVIEVHHVVLHHLRKEHDVTDDLRIGGDLDVQRVFHGTHRSQRVHSGADAADTFAERPGIARVAAL